MKRVYAVLTLIVLVGILAVPAIAHGDGHSGFVQAGWTWDES